MPPSIRPVEAVSWPLIVVSSPAGDWVGMSVGLTKGVEVGIGSGAHEHIGVGVGDVAGVGVAPTAGTAAAARDCATGDEMTTASPELLLESIALPATPPGLRSRLEPAGGALPASASTNDDAASPQLSESITAPASVRSTSDPPVADKPPLYVPSAPGAYTPPELAISTWRCAGTASAVQLCLRVTVAPLEVT